MPHTASAWKRLRKAEKRRRQNKLAAKKIKSQRKAVAAALADSDAAKAATEFKNTQAVLDRAANKGYIHKNKAARLKSRLVKAARKQFGAAVRAKPRVVMLTGKPKPTAAQLAERRRAEAAIADRYPGQDVAYVDEWTGDTLDRIVVAASPDPVTFQDLLAALAPEVRRRVQLTSVPDPTEGPDVPSVQFA